MYYWNKDNFEGLEELANQLDGDARLLLLATYCRLRARGLRGNAFQTLDQFLASVEELAHTDKREIVGLILELHTQSPKVHQFLSTPLMERLVCPTVDAWLTCEPQSVEALRWDGLIDDNLQSLRDALTLDPDDVVIRQMLLSRCLSQAWDAVHHIDESVLLTDILVIDRWLDEAGQMLEAAPNREPFADHASVLAEYRRLIDDWKSFSEDGGASFPEWCARHDRRYDWIPVKVYYNK